MLSCSPEAQGPSSCGSEPKVNLVTSGFHFLKCHDPLLMLLAQLAAAQVPFPYDTAVPVILL